MPSSDDLNVYRQEPPAYYRPLLQLDNSPSWVAEQPSTAHFDRPPQSYPHAQHSSHIQREAGPVLVDDDYPPTKHEGRVFSATPTSAASPSPRSVSRTLSTSPPTSQGHIRSPVLVRPQTMLENFSRTVRSYVPSSIPVPASVPSSPRVSRPVSFGGFVGTNPGPFSAHSGEQDLMVDTPPDQRRTHQSPSRPSVRQRGSVLGSPDMQVGSLPRDDGNVHRNPLLTAYPTAAEGDNVMWSHWDSLPQRGPKHRRVLFLGYSSGFQMWDCANLASVSELLNLSGPEWGHVTFAGVLPPPVTDDSQLAALRPLIGVISKMQGHATMLIYSLHSHEVVKRLPFHNVSSFASSGLFTVISTTNPPTLHILSSASLTILHTISSSSIFAYSRTSTHKPNTNNIVSPSGIDRHDPEDISAPDDPVPIYSLSHRLLAFAVQPPRSDSPHDPTALQPRAHIRASSTPFGISQVDIGNAAIKVGGSVLSGMKSLGGMAFQAATEYARSRSGAAPRSREDAAPRLLSTHGTQPASAASGVTNMFFSRSAPAASVGNHDHDREDHGHTRGATTTGNTTPVSDAEDVHDTWFAHNAPVYGSYIRVLDLGPLMHRRTSSHPQNIAEFVAVKHQPISHLMFTHDGNSLLVGSKDGQVVRVFQLRRRVHALRVSNRLEGDSGKGKGGSEQQGKPAATGARREEDAPWHVYNLHRGRTSAVIQGMEVSRDGRWAAIGTEKGTVHVFAINPYGGQPDLRSHMDNKIWNVDKPQPLSIELRPIVRLRSTRTTGADGFRSDLSFTFVSGNEMSVPTSLLPSQMASSPSTSSGRSDLLSSHSSQRQHSFKDVLIFDASGGVLSLRRITLEQRLRESGIPFSAPIASLATSISLPGVGASGRLSTSPPTQRRSGLTQQMLEAASELVGKEGIMATWQLKRRYDWGQVKRVMHEVGEQTKPGLSNALAQAELSTCARAPGLVPRSIYLSHQFLFYTLGEDYHALIRRHRLAISGAKIDVRKEVEASASAGPSGAQFVEDLAFPSDHAHVHGVSSSFDKPLANAMSAEMGYDVSAGRDRVMIPMLPNGASQQSARARTVSSWGGSGTRAALSGMSGGIPIRMMEGVGGMIRREMDRVRGSGRGIGIGMRSVSGGSGGGSSASGQVPLEFNEDDEDFEEHVPVGTTGEGGGDRGEDGEDLWRAWAEEDKLAVDEAERFDDVLGIMDEDQPATVGILGNRTSASASGAPEW